MINDKLLEEVREYAKTHSMESASRHFNVHRQTITNWKNKYGIEFGTTFKEERKQELIKFIKENAPYKSKMEISAETGKDYGTIAQLCSELNIKTKANFYFDAENAKEYVEENLKEESRDMQIYKLRQRGYKYSTIGKVYGMTKQNVHQICRRMEIKKIKAEAE